VPSHRWGVVGERAERGKGQVKADAGGGDGGEAEEAGDLRESEVGGGPVGGKVGIAQAGELMGGGIERMHGRSSGLAFGKGGAEVGLAYERPVGGRHEIVERVLHGRSVAEGGWVTKGFGYLKSLVQISSNGTIEQTGAGRSPTFVG
jgi:hypothetical protein